ncbi:MAG: PRC-barrel domain-containing protein [Sphingomicrobium sp.]
MRLTDLRDAKVRTLDGKTLGHVHEVHAEGGRIVAITCGSGSLIERLTAKKHGRRIPWECVRKVSHKEVIVTPDPPQRGSRRSAPRSPQGTRRPSARPSKR